MAIWAKWWDGNIVKLFLFFGFGLFLIFIVCASLDSVTFVFDVAVMFPF
jgi:hypothetical protein